MKRVEDVALALEETQAITHELYPDQRRHATEYLEALEVQLLCLLALAFIQAEASNTERKCGEQEHVGREVDDSPEALQRRVNTEIIG